MKRKSGRNAVLAGAGVAALALALGGCGRVGALERPAPLFGERAKAEYRAEKEAAKEEAARRHEAEQNATGSAEADSEDMMDTAPASPPVATPPHE